MELKEKVEFSKEEIRSIEEVVDLIYKEMNILSSNIFTKKFIFGIFSSLVKSVPIKNFIKFCQLHDKYDNSDYLENLYQDYNKLPKTNFYAKDLKKRVKTKYEYYKKAFLLRAKIQNIQWDYRGLDTTIRNFIEGKEIIYISYDKIQTMKQKEYISCINCKTKWLSDEQDICPRCEKMNDIGMFIKLTNYFCILGDMKIFYESLDTETSNTLYDNWKYILNFLEQKRRKRYHSIWNEKKVEYGIPQYNKIIKYDGGDWGISPELKAFNKKYNLALVSGSIEIDFNQATNTKNEDFLLDVSKLKFPLCFTLILPEVKFKSNLNLFEPKMPKLIKLIAKNCFLKEVDLKEDSFPSLKELNLDDNLIEKYENIKNLNKIESLRIVTIFNNPIEKTSEIYISEKEFFKRNIDLRYSPIKKYNNIERIDNESDSEVKRIAKKHIYFNESECSDSNEEN